MVENAALHPGGDLTYKSVQSQKSMRTAQSVARSFTPQ